MNLRVVLRSLWIPILTATLAVAASVAYSSNAAERFQSRGTYVIGPAPGLTEPETIVRSFDSLQGQGIVPTLVELLSSDAIAEQVGRPLGLSRQDLERYDIAASVLSSSNTLELAVTGPDPQRTARLAQGIGTRASAVFEDLYSVYQIRELDQPLVPDEPYSPQPVRNAVLALLLGVTVGAAAVVYRVREARGPFGGQDAVAAGPGLDLRRLRGDRTTPSAPGRHVRAPGPLAGHQAAPDDGRPAAVQSPTGWFDER